MRSNEHGLEGFLIVFVTECKIAFPVYLFFNFFALFLKVTYSSYPEPAKKKIKNFYD